MLLGRRDGVWGVVLSRRGGGHMGRNWEKDEMELCASG